MSNTLIVYDGTPDQRAAAQTLWATATFPRGFLEGHQVKLHFKPDVGTAFTARGGSIVMGDHHPPTSVGPILVHEIGHLGDFWCLTDADRQEILDTDLQQLDVWYQARENWADSFGRKYMTPGVRYYGYGSVSETTVGTLMDGCDSPPEPTFSDVPADHPYYDSIEWAAENGITTGYPDGTYRPDDTVTRGEMAVFLKRAAGI